MYILILNFEVWDDKFHQLFQDSSSHYTFQSRDKAIEMMRRITNELKEDTSEHMEKKFGLIYVYL